MAISGSSAYVFIAVAAVLWLVQRRIRSPSLPYPPGPPRKPFIGNALDIPKAAIEQSRKYSEWERVYGSLIHLDAMGTHIIVINDVRIATDLLDKRSSIYSDRPTMIMAGDLCGWDRQLVLSHYGNTRFKELRRYIFKMFGTRQNFETYIPILGEEICAMMMQMITNPDNFVRHIRKCASSITLRMAYGYRPCLEGNDPVLEVMEEAMQQTDDLLTKLYLVDLFPWMRHIPSWFPGAQFQKKAKYYRKMLDEMCDFPYRIAVQTMREGVAEPCFIQRQMDEGDYTPEKEQLTKWTATSIYGGGTDTTISSITSFFLAMTIYPDILRKAQAEIDSIVGRDRLPTLEDRPNLPYIDALQQEVLRWNPVGPLAIPHGSTEDDIYEGYFIPKGSVIVTNLWHLLNNPDVHKTPRQFNPDRFIATPDHPAEPDPREVTFGFGRRICPGQNLADAMTWLEIAVAVAVLDISRARDVDGNEIVPEGEYDDGLVMQPVPFPCVVKARDTQAEAVVRASATEQSH